MPTYSELARSVKRLTPLVPTDLILLLGGDANTGLTNAKDRALKPGPNDSKNQPRLEFDSDSGVMTYWIDPDTYLITHARLGKSFTSPGLDQDGKIVLITALRCKSIMLNWRRNYSPSTRPNPPLPRRSRRC